MYVEQFGNPATSDDVELDLYKLEANWKRYIDRGAGDNALFWAVLRVFARRLCILFMLSTVCAALSFASPFLILYLLRFI